MRSFICSGITTPVVLETIRYSRRVQLWNRQALIITDLTTLALSSRAALPSARMSTEEVLKALGPRSGLPPRG
jgi:hypothetical protein